MGSYHACNVYKHLRKLWCTHVYGYVYEHVLGIHIGHSTCMGASTDVNPETPNMCTDVRIEVCAYMHAYRCGKGTLGSETCI